jgi:predicted MFS family arabinose efflux permease
MVLTVHSITDQRCRLATTLLLNGLTLIVLWPVSTTLPPLIVFSVMNGIASGGFFSLMPTVAGQVFGSARVAVALGMLVTGWSFGYLMVSAATTGVHRASG